MGYLIKAVGHQGSIPVRTRTGLAKEFLYDGLMRGGSTSILLITGHLFTVAYGSVVTGEFSVSTAHRGA